MNKLTFTPTSYTGWGCLQQLLVEVKKFQANNILIVTDPFLQDLGLVDQVKKPLLDNGYKTTIYTDIAPEPPLAIGEKLVAYTRNHQFDLVIGLGGEVH